jgi:hypothetical protein
MSESPPPVDVKTRFDQFPATIKGAFVMRGADGNPHAVDLQECAIERLPSGPGGRSVPMGDLRVNVGPLRDLFVPFEIGVADLEPGWYALRATVRVDAGRTWRFSSRAFVVPWPREQVRRGTVKVGRAVRAGDESFVIDAVEMRADCTVVTWHREDPAGVSADAEVPGPRVLMEGAELDRLPPGVRPPVPRSDFGPAIRSVFYPVPKGNRTLVVLMTGTSGAESSPVELSLA